MEVTEEYATEYCEKLQEVRALFLLMMGYRNPHLGVVWRFVSENPRAIRCTER